MAAVRTAIALSAALAVPTFVGTPYLYSDSSTAREPRMDAGRYNQLSVAGYYIYEAQCRDCHGKNAHGTDRGPSLHYRVYKPQMLKRKAFHGAVNNGVAQNRWEYGDMPRVRLSFNEVEQVARFVRDVQRGIKFP